MAVYVRRWWPSKYQLDAVVEVIVDEYSYEDLITKVRFASLTQVYPILFYSASVFSGRKFIGYIRELM